MGAGLFGGSPGAAVRSLVSHLVYGAVLGAIYGTAEARAPTHPAHVQA